MEEPFSILPYQRLRNSQHLTNVKQQILRICSGTPGGDNTKKVEEIFECFGIVCVYLYVYLNVLAMYKLHLFSKCCWQFHKIANNFSIIFFSYN